MQTEEAAYAAIGKNHGWLSGLNGYSFRQGEVGALSMGDLKVTQSAFYVIKRWKPQILLVIKCSFLNGQTLSPLFILGIQEMRKTDQITQVRTPRRCETWTWTGMGEQEVSRQSCKGRGRLEDKEEAGTPGQRRPRRIGTRQHAWREWAGGLGDERVCVPGKKKNKKQ